MACKRWRVACYAQSFCAHPEDVLCWRCTVLHVMPPYSMTVPHSICSTACTGYEKRWTLFSTFWFMVVATRYYGIPPALRFLVYLGWRTVMTKAYEAHKLLVLWRECAA